MQRLHQALSGTLLCLGLAACGGGSDGGVPATPATPTAEQRASASIDGLVNYTSTMTDAPAVSADAVEPADVEAVTPPTTETDEPKDVG